MADRSDADDQAELPVISQEDVAAMTAKVRAAGHDLVRLRTADDVRRCFAVRSKR